MPAAIAAVLAVATTIGTFLGLAGIAATIVGAVVIVGTLALAKKALDRKKSSSAGASGALLNRTGSSVAVPVVYGTRRIGGTRIFMGSNGTKNNDLHMVLLLCEGPIEGATKLYFNDEEVATSTNNGASWTIIAKYSSYLSISFHDGTQTTADAGLVGEGIGWTNSHIGYNCAYAYIKYVWNEDVFGSGLPNSTFLVKGKKIPQIGSSQSSTLSWSDDPARIIYDYLTNELYGKSIPYTLFQATSFNESATYNTQSVTNLDGSSEQRYKCNAYIDTEQSMLDNVEELLTTFRAGLVTGSEYQIIQDRPKDVNTAVVINDDNIIGDIKFLQANKRTLANQLVGTFPNQNADYNYQEDIFTLLSTTLQGATYDGLVLKKDLALNHTTSETMVGRIMMEEINQSRQSGVVELQVNAQMLDLVVGDLTSVTNSTLGQTNKLYRILSTVLEADHTITLSMREYDPNVYWDNNNTIIINNNNDTDH